ncbi:hypothetical protein BHE74_00023948 [Ensete ventricosum]|nr:hypothetical protein BHE74_00023948 [Ensete ventricosum]
MSKLKGCYLFQQKQPIASHGERNRKKSSRVFEGFDPPCGRQQRTPSGEFWEDRFLMNPLPLPFRLVWCPAGPTITKPLAGDQLTTAASPDGGGPPRTFLLPPHLLLLPALRVRCIPPLLDLSLLSSAAALQSYPQISPLRWAVTDQPPRPCPLLRRRRRPLRAPVRHHGYPPHSPLATAVLILILFLFWVRPDHLGVFGWEATRNSYESILMTLQKPGGGEFGKYYSLPALTDPRIGKDFDDFRCDRERCGEDSGLGEYRA